MAAISASAGLVAASGMAELYDANPAQQCPISLLVTTAPAPTRTCRKRVAASGYDRLPSTMPPSAQDRCCSGLTCAKAAAGYTPLPRALLMATLF